MPPDPSAVELRADCPHCRLESGLVELYDPMSPACRFGLPTRARCNLCTATYEGVLESARDTAQARPLREIAANRCPACLVELGPNALDERRCASCGVHAVLAPKTAPAELSSRAALLDALQAWAARDGFASLQKLLDATFCEPDVDALFARILRGEPIEVLADPFASMGMRTSRGSSTHRAAAPTSSSTLRAVTPATSSPQRAAPAAPASTSTRAAPPAPVPSPAPPPTAARGPTLPPPSAPPRAIVYPLVSVIAADGEIHPEERRLIDRFLQSEGLAPLADDEFRVHHPSAVAHLVPSERRETVVQLMCETAAIDGMPDESERRVIRAYATAWSVSDEKVDFWMWGYENMSTSVVRQLWLKLRRFVLSARWADEDRR